MCNRNNAVCDKQLVIRIPDLVKHYFSPVKKNVTISIAEDCVIIFSTNDWSLWPRKKVICLINWLSISF